MSKRAPACGITACVRVAGMNLPVVVRDPNLDTYLDERFGYCDHVRRRIVLNGTNSAEGMKECCLHEVVHATDDAAKIGLDELQVARLARALFAVIRDNPELMMWLQDET